MTRKTLDHYKTASPTPHKRRTYAARSIAARSRADHARVARHAIVPKSSRSRPGFAHAGGRVPQETEVQASCNFRDIRPRPLNALAYIYRDLHLSPFSLAKTQANSIQE